MRHRLQCLKIHMRPLGRIDKNAYPSGAILAELASEIDAAQLDPAAPRVLQRLPVESHPCKLGACAEICPHSSSFVMSSRRGKGKCYTTVAGKRSHRGKGMKKSRSKQDWPRTVKTDRLRPISLHRWICFEMHGPPPSELHEATHICGNDSCVAGAHLRWQLSEANFDDLSFHQQHPPTTPRSSTESKRHYSRLAWSK